MSILNDSEDSIEQKNAEANRFKELKKKFTRARKLRLSKLKDQILLSGHDYEIEEYEQEKSSKYLYLKAQNYKEGIFNKDFSTKNGKMKSESFAFYLDYGTLSNVDSDVLYDYVEIHSKNRITGIICKNIDNLEKCLKGRNEHEYNKRNLKVLLKQIELSQEFITPKKHKLERDTWIDLLQDSSPLSIAFETTENDVKNANVQSIWLQSFILSYSLIATTEYKTNHYPIYICNFIGTDEEHRKVKELFQELYFNYGELRDTETNAVRFNNKIPAERLAKYGRVTVVDCVGENENTVSDYFKDYIEYISYFHEDSCFPYRGLFVTLSSSQFDDNMYRNINLSNLSGMLTAPSLDVFKFAFEYFFIVIVKELRYSYSLVISGFATMYHIKHGPSDYTNKNKAIIFDEAINYCSFLIFEVSVREMKKHAADKLMIKKVFGAVCEVLNIDELPSPFELTLQGIKENMPNAQKCTCKEQRPDKNEVNSCFFIEEGRLYLGKAFIESLVERIGLGDYTEKTFARDCNKNGYSEVQGTSSKTNLTLKDNTTKRLIALFVNEKCEIIKAPSVNVSSKDNDETESE